MTTTVAPPYIQQPEHAHETTPITAAPTSTATSPFAKYLTRQVVQEWEALEQAFPPTTTATTTYDWKDLQVQSVLGQGGFGIVLECSCSSTQDVVAVKCVKAKTIHNDLDMMAAASDLYLEGQWLTMLRGHEHIVELQGVSSQGLSTAYTQDNSDNGYFLVLPVLGETLAQRLLSSSSSSSGKPDVRHALSTMVLPLASALVHVHDHNLVYRDLKPENIAFDSGNVLKLIDFGLCRPLSSMVGVGQVAGSVPYMAPEILLGQSTHLASDVYSFGILAHYILTGMAPLRQEGSLQDAQQDELQRRRQRQSRFPKTSNSKLLPKNLAKLLHACVQDDPLDRPTMQQVLQELQAILLVQEQPKKKKPKTLWKQLSRKLSSSLSTNATPSLHPSSETSSVDGWTATGSSSSASSSSNSAVRHKTATSSSLIDQWFTISVVPPNE